MIWPGRGRRQHHRTPRRGLLADRTGLASVELAILTALVIVPLFCGAIDYGFILHAALRGEEAYRAATYYAWMVGNTAPLDMTAVTQAALGAVANDPNISVVPKLLYFCVGPVGGHGSAVGSATVLSCAAPTVLATYLSVAVTTTVPLPVPFSYLASTYTINTGGMARVK